MGVGGIPASEQRVIYTFSLYLCSIKNSAAAVYNPDFMFLYHFYVSYTLRKWAIMVLHIFLPFVTLSNVYPFSILPSPRSIIHLLSRLLTRSFLPLICQMSVKFSESSFFIICPIIFSCHFWIACFFLLLFCYHMKKRLLFIVSAYVTWLPVRYSNWPPLGKYQLYPPTRKVVAWHPHLRNWQLETLLEK